SKPRSRHTAPQVVARHTAGAFAGRSVEGLFVTALDAPGTGRRDLHCLVAGAAKDLAWGTDLHPLHHGSGKRRDRYIGLAMRQPRAMRRPLRSSPPGSVTSRRPSATSMASHLAAIG